MFGWHIVWFYAKQYGYGSKEHRLALSRYK
jgi:hypothetical protein